ncbi:Fatty acid-binding protein [Grifola frondosa]|uniref:Fatty acid-binding protein n=1 Tax=Grifola frondosa TaxID=5627 RepID=A0A1C7MBB1_GRIFR|nr:Fatty acid-binding protein [Grifola frondosa]
MLPVCSVPQRSNGLASHTIHTYIRVLVLGYLSSTSIFLLYHHLIVFCTFYGFTAMSDIKVEGFKSSEILAALAAVFDGYNEEEKKAQIKKTNGIFELRVKNEAGKEAIWTIDLKTNGTVYKGTAKSKPNVTILLSDDTFQQLAQGKLDGQKAFMTGKLKTKGNMMFATKLDGVLKSARTKAKL